MILVPAFSGPPTTLGKNLSKFDQLSLTLLLHKEGKQIENVSILDTYVNKAIPIAIKTQRSSLGHNLCGRNMSYNCSENKQNNTTTDSTPFTLFGGSLAVPQFVENPNRSHSSNVNDKGNRIVTDTVQPKDIVHEHVSAKANENSLRNSQLGVSTSQSSASNSSKPKTNKFSMLGKLLQKSSTDLKSNHNGDGSVELPVASKRKKLSDAASIEQPTKRRTVPSISNVMSSVQTRISMSDFAGIEGFCRNAGASPKGLQSLLQKLSKTESVVLSVVWSSLITNHATTTTKFCTPSVPCTKWNCSCDRNIRAKHAVSEILGLLVLLPAELNHIYFLPLVPCIHASTGSLEIVDSVKSIMNLPLTCNTSLMDRWNAVRDLLSMDQGQNSSECSKIIYNGQLALMPIINALEAKSESRQSLNAEYNDLFDPRVAAYLCETDINEKQLELDALFMKYDVDLPPLNANNCGKISAVLAEAKIEMIGLLQVYQKLKVALIASKTLSLFATVEMPIVVILSRMECRGISISESRLVAIRNSIAVKIDEKESEAKVLVGKSFNLASPEQVSNILYEDLKLPPPQTSHNSNKKASKHLSTAEEDLLRIKALHPIVEVILSYRSLAKLQSTYVNNYQQFINHENMSLASNVSPSDVDFPGWEKENCGKVHACWTQTNVRTGRLSCCKPNLQNLPNRQTIAGLDVDLRSVFLPSFG